MKTFKDRLIKLATEQVKVDIIEDNNLTAIEGMFVHLLLNKDKGEQVLYDFLSDSAREILKGEFKDYKSFVVGE